MRGGLVDPRLLGEAGWLGSAVEPLRVLGVCAVEGGLAPGANLGCGSEVD